MWFILFLSLLTGAILLKPVSAVVSVPSIKAACLCRGDLGFGYSTKSKKCMQGSSTNCFECKYQTKCIGTSIVIGSGKQGYTGDCPFFPNDIAKCKSNVIFKPALASLSNPSSIVLDKYANLFFADTSNNRVRMLTNDGILATVAGNGQLF